VPEILQGWQPRRQRPARGRVVARGRVIPQRFMRALLVVLPDEAADALLLRPPVIARPNPN
jgi:hypothetical protein